MPPKKKDAWMDDGDDAHWGASKRSKKKVSVADSGRTAKYTGKRKGTRKKITKK